MKGERYIYIKKIMKIILKEIYKNIKEEKGTFFSSIVSFILIFTLINIFVFGFLNTNAYRLRQEQGNQLIVYVNKNVDEEGKNELQKKLLNIEGVSSLRYLSKELALKNLEKEINVDLSKEENPLEDAFFVNLTRNVDIKKLETNLKSLTEISEIDMREKLITQTVNFSNNLDRFIKYSSVILIIFSVIMIFNIAMLSIKTRRAKIYVNLRNNKDLNVMKTSFFLENVLSILIASIFSYFIYLYAKYGIIKLISATSSDYVIPDTSFSEIIVLSIVFIVAIILSLIINYLLLNKYYTLEYYEGELEELREEIEEDIQNSNEIEKLKQMQKNVEDDFEEFTGGK